MNNTHQLDVSHGQEQATVNPLQTPPEPGYYWVSIDGKPPVPARVRKHVPVDDEDYDGLSLDMLSGSSWKLAQMVQHRTLKFWPITPPEV